MSDTVTQFIAKVSRHSRDEPVERMAEFQRMVMSRALKMVVYATPVDTGALRGDWQLAIGRISSGGGPPDKSGSTTIARGMTVIQSLKKMQFASLGNSKVYAEPIENGHSKQAPQGMVMPTAAALLAVLK